MLNLVLRTFSLPSHLYVRLLSAKPGETHGSQQRRNTRISKKVAKLLKITDPKVTTNNTATISSNFEVMINLLHFYYPNYELETYGQMVNNIVETFNKFIWTLGIEYGTKHFNKVKSYIINLFEGRPPEPDRFGIGKKDKFPNCLGRCRFLIKDFLSEESSDITKSKILQILYTLLNIPKLCRGLNSMELSGIEETFAVDESTTAKFQQYLEFSLWDYNPIDFVPGLVVEIPLLGPANGPNKVRKDLSSDLEAYLIVYNGEYKDILSSIKMYCDLTENQPFFNYLKVRAEMYRVSGKTTKGVLRKLVTIADAGNKPRTVAIPDFWTQTLFAPLEAQIIRLLLWKFGDKSSYYSHSKGWTKVLSTHEEWVSIDASAWTDNFPVTLQSMVLEKLTNKAIASSWKSLAADCTWNVGSSNTTCKYGKGQGMGTKASFAIASLTDHFFIEWVLDKSYGFIQEYNKVGDDLVIVDPLGKLAENYELIGVPVNQLKSKGVFPNGHFVEYVSRNAYNFIDVSQWSASLLTKVSKQHFYIPTLIHHIKERTNWDSDQDPGSLIFNSINYKSDSRKDKDSIIFDIYQLAVYRSRELINTPEIACTYVKDNISSIIYALTQETVSLTNQFRKLKSFREHDNLKEKITKDVNYDLGLWNDFSVSKLDIWSFAATHNLDVNDIFWLHNSGARNIASRDLLDRSSDASVLISIPSSSSENGDAVFVNNVKVLSLVFACLLEARSRLRRESSIRVDQLTDPQNIRKSVELLKTLNSIVDRVDNNEIIITTTIPLGDTVFLFENPLNSSEFSNLQLSNSNHLLD